MMRAVGRKFLLTRVRTCRRLLTERPRRAREGARRPSPFPLATSTTCDNNRTLMCRHAASLFPLRRGAGSGGYSAFATWNQNLEAHR